MSYFCKYRNELIKIENRTAFIYKVNNDERVLTIWNPDHCRERRQKQIATGDTSNWEEGTVTYSIWLSNSIICVISQVCFFTIIISYWFWNFMQDLLEALNQLDEGLKDNIKKLSSFDKYKQEVLLGHLDWTPVHKDPMFWRDNISNFEENDFQVFFVSFWVLSSWFYLLNCDVFIDSVLYMHNIDDNRKILIVQLTSPNCAIDLPKVYGFHVCEPIAVHIHTCPHNITHINVHAL